MRHASLLLALVLVVAGCAAGAAAPGAHPTSPPSTRPTVVVTEPPTTTTTVVLPPAVPVAWHPCGRPLECATVAVPVSYEEPTGPTLGLALVRHPASRPDERIGTLLVNPGGPGASGVRRVARGFDVSQEVADRFDIVGFDPRGVGGSEPITCGTAVPAFRATDFAPDTPAQEAALEAAATAVAHECTATEGHRLLHLGTAQVANDVEVIRRALGEPQVSFVGLSYGTLIGQLWADTYPGSVRALVLDGVVDPASGGASSSVDQAEGIESAFAAMDSDCAAMPQCPLHGSGGLTASYDELARRLHGSTEGPTAVGRNQLAYAAFYATYDPATWPDLWQAVAAGLAGDLSGVDDLASRYEHLVPYTTFALITCLDGPHPVGYTAWEAQAAAMVHSSPRFGKVLANELLPCAFWPETGYIPRTVRAIGAPPILVIGSTGDAATPYAAAVDVAHALRSGVLLTVKVDGHVALGDSDCATQIATRYLVDLAVPTPGTRC